MPQTNSYDALVVGAGPNGLSAGIAIAQTGRSVLVVEGRDTIGGGARSAALTLPGFLHDVCSASTRWQLARHSSPRCPSPTTAETGCSVPRRLDFYQSLIPAGTGTPRYEKPELRLGTADWLAGFCHSPPMPPRGTSPRATLFP